MAENLGQLRRNPHKAETCVYPAKRHCLVAGSVKTLQCIWPDSCEKNNVFRHFTFRDFTLFRTV